MQRNILGVKENLQYEVKKLGYALPDEGTLKVQWEIEKERVREV